MEDIAKKYFSKEIGNKERAIFELGIALGFVYHQFIATPFRKKDLEIIEKAIEASLLAQPYRIYAKVEIKAKDYEGTYSYEEITKENLTVEVKVKYGEYVATGKLEYIKEMNYPLMYVKDVEKA